MIKKNKNTRLTTLLNVLSKREQQAFSQFLASPYFNQRQDLINLFELLLPTIGLAIAPTSEELWQQLYPQQAYNAQNMRLLMSYLSRLAEQFLALENSSTQAFGRKMQAADSLRQRGEDKLADTFLREAQRVLEKQAYRHADYWLQAYQHQAASYREAYAERPEKNESFHTFSQVLDHAFLAMKLRQNMARINHEKVYQWSHEASSLDTFVAQLSETDIPQEPAHLLYFYGTQLLQQEDNEAAFQKFKQTLFNNSQFFPEEEAFEFYNLAINFGIRQVNRGQKRYFHDVMDLYKDGLQQGYLLRKGVLSRFTYHNVVSIALQIDEHAWAETFIDQWTNKLERRYRERMYNFNRAKIAYAAKDYTAALPLLQQANYHDPLLNLGARSLLLKIYFELKEWDVLLSHLDAFQNYVRRKPGLTYHRAYYHNLIRFTRKLLKLAPHQKLQRQQLHQQIMDAEHVNEKEWLLERCELAAS